MTQPLSRTTSTQERDLIESSRIDWSEDTSDHPPSGKSAQAVHYPHGARSQPFNFDPLDDTPALPSQLGSVGRWLEYWSQETTSHWGSFFAGYMAAVQDLQRQPSVVAPTPAYHLSQDQRLAIKRFVDMCGQVSSIRRVYVREEPDGSIVVTVLVDEFSREVLRQVADLERSAVEHNPLVAVDFEVHEESDFDPQSIAWLGEPVYAADD